MNEENIEQFDPELTGQEGQEESSQTPQTPDLSQFVPVDQFNELATRLAQMEGRLMQASQPAQPQEEEEDDEAIVTVAQVRQREQRLLNQFQETLNRALTPTVRAGVIAEIAGDVNESGRRFLEEQLSALPADTLQQIAANPQVKELYRLAAIGASKHTANDARVPSSESISRGKATDPEGFAEYREAMKRAGYSDQEIRESYIPREY